MAASLSSGSRLPRASSMPASRAMARGRGLVVAGQHHRGDARARAVRPRASRETVLDGVGHRKDGQHLRRRRQQADGAALRLRALRSAASSSATAQAALLDQPVVAEHVGRAADVGLDAAPGKAVKSFGLHAVWSASPAAIARDTGWSEWPGQAAAQAGTCGFGDRRSQHLRGDQLGLAFGDGAGLVQRDGLAACARSSR